MILTLKLNEEGQLFRIFHANFILINLSLMPTIFFNEKKLNWDIKLLFRRLKINLVSCENLYGAYIPETLRRGVVHLKWGGSSQVIGKPTVPYCMTNKE